MTNLERDAAVIRLVGDLERLLQDRDSARWLPSLTGASVLAAALMGIAIFILRG